MTAQPTPTGPDFAGVLRCETCLTSASLNEVDAAYSIEHEFWPRCCEQTMRWWSADQIAAGEVPRWGDPVRFCEKCGARLMPATIQESGRAFHHPLPLCDANWGWIAFARPDLLPEHQRWTTVWPSGTVVQP